MLTRSLRTDSLTRADIPAAVGLAVAALHSIIARPGAFAADQVREHLPPFLETRIASNRSIGIHRTDGSLVGYAAYDQFPFHGDAAAFLPVMACATAPEAAADLTELIYTTLAARWIRDGVRKHLVSLPPDRHDVETIGKPIGAVEAFRGRMALATSSAPLGQGRVASRTGRD